MPLPDSQPNRNRQEQDCDGTGDDREDRRVVDKDHNDEQADRADDPENSCRCALGLPVLAVLAAVDSPEAWPGRRWLGHRVVLPDIG